MRLDQAIAARFELSRRKARELIAAGRVLVNSRPVRVASREIGAEATLAIADETPSLTLLAVHDDWLAVDKPAGLPTQPPRDRATLSLEELLRVQFREIYLIHRLDTPTSGAVVFARTKPASARLSALFASRAVLKTYVALIHGELACELVIDSPIQGKDARTIVRPIEPSLGASPGLSRIEAVIETGRTHQIRIHLASIGHPVAGDRRYGVRDDAKRLMLHAWKLEHPELGTIEAPVPF